MIWSQRISLLNWCSFALCIILQWNELPNTIFHSLPKNSKCNKGEDQKEITSYAIKYYFEVKNEYKSICCFYVVKSFSCRFWVLFESFKKLFFRFSTKFQIICVVIKTIWIFFKFIWYSRSHSIQPSWNQWVQSNSFPTSFFFETSKKFTLVVRKAKLDNLLVNIFQGFCAHFCRRKIARFRLNMMNLWSWLHPSTREKLEDYRRLWRPIKSRLSLALNFSPSLLFSTLALKFSFSESLFLH